MAIPIARDLRFDKRLDSYGTFFDHAWFKKLGTLSDGHPVDPHVMDLGITWRGIANTHAMPWLLMSTLKGLWNGLTSRSEPMGKIIIRELSRNLVLRMGSDLTESQQAKLRSEIQQLGLTAFQAAEEGRVPFDEAKVWNALLYGIADERRLTNDQKEIKEFRWGIWGSQRVCYAGLYFAYEDFVKCVVGTHRGEANYGPRGAKQLAAGVSEAFGEDIADECFGCEAITIACLTRNALAHNGGRISEPLARMNHGFTVVDDVIQIQAPNTRALFDLLKVAAYRLTEAAVTA